MRSSVSRSGKAGRLGKAFLLSVVLMSVLVGPTAVAATVGPASPVGIHVKFDAAESPEEVSRSIKILMLLTALTLAPSAIIMCTSFTRVLIVFGLLKRALGLQQSPPPQVIAGISLFLTIFIMMPVWQQINETAVKPYMDGEMPQKQAFEEGVKPLHAFMRNQTGEAEIDLFVDLSKTDTTSMEPKDLPLPVLIPSFMISELKTAFQMGFLIYLPFLVIDLVIASSLMSLGMMMLPPMMISLPIKILFFVLADGWTLVVRGMVTSFTV